MSLRLPRLELGFSGEDAMSASPTELAIVLPEMVTGGADEDDDLAQSEAETLRKSRAVAAKSDAKLFASDEARLPSRVSSA